jgi:hypothetical protein
MFSKKSTDLKNSQKQASPTKISTIVSRVSFIRIGSLKVNFCFALGRMSGSIVLPGDPAHLEWAVGIGLRYRNVSFQFGELFP